MQPTGGGRAIAANERGRGVRAVGRASEAASAAAAWGASVSERGGTAAARSSAHGRSADGERRKPPAETVGGKGWRAGELQNSAGAGLAVGGRGNVGDELQSGGPSHGQ